MSTFFALTKQCRMEPVCWLCRWEWLNITARWTNSEAVTALCTLTSQYASTAWPPENEYISKLDCSWKLYTCTIMYLPTIRLQQTVWRCCFNWEIKHIKTTERFITWISSLVISLMMHNFTFKFINEINMFAKTTTNTTTITSVNRKFPAQCNVIYTSRLWTTASWEFSWMNWNSWGHLFVTMSCFARTAIRWQIAFRINFLGNEMSYRLYSNSITKINSTTRLESHATRLYCMCDNRRVLHVREPKTK